MPPATFVRDALPVNFATMMSCLGPHAFSHLPTISTGIGSGLLPWNTVHATPFMPGFTAPSGKSSTFPALGGIVIFGMPFAGSAAINAGKMLKAQTETTRNLGTNSKRTDSPDVHIMTQEDPAPPLKSGCFTVRPARPQRQMGRSRGLDIKPVLLVPVRSIWNRRGREAQPPVLAPLPVAPRWPDEDPSICAQTEEHFAPWTLPFGCRCPRFSR